MVSSKVQRIIVQMSAFSACASSLIEHLSISADEVGGSGITPRPVVESVPDVVDVNALVEKINTLTSKVNELMFALKATSVEEIPDLDLEGDTYTSYVASVRHTVSLLDLPALCDVYTLPWFSIQPRNVRFITASELLNDCARRSIQPLPLWESIAATNGNIH